MSHRIIFIITCAQKSKYLPLAWAQVRRRWRHADDGTITV